MDIKAEIETLTSIKKMDNNSLAKVNKCGIVNIGISTSVNSEKHNYDFYVDNTGKKNIYITLGSDGEFEKEMQQILFEGGYYSNFPGKTPPAVYNAYTSVAVKAFQKKYGLVQNGIVEQRTWAYIKMQETINMLRKNHQGDAADKREAYLIKNKLDVPYKLLDKTECYQGVDLDKFYLDLCKSSALVYLEYFTDKPSGAISIIKDLKRFIENPSKSNLLALTVDGVFFALPGDGKKLGDIAEGAAEAKVINVPKSVERQVKKLSPEAKKSYDKAIEGLKNGDTRGLFDHPLGADRAGERAVDIKGIGKGRGQGRIVYKRNGDGSIDIIEILTKHDY